MPKRHSGHGSGPAGGKSSKELTNLEFADNFEDVDKVLQITVAF